MQQFTTTTTQNNQVTIPAEVCRQLRIKPRDRVTFTVEDDGHVSVTAATSKLKTRFKPFKPRAEGLTLQEIIREAKEEKVERTMRELRES